MQKKILLAFDFDGVIADTIPMLSQTFSLFLERYGINPCDEPFESYNGKTLFDILSNLHEKYDLHETVTQLVTMYHAELLEQIQTIAPMQHLPSTLETLKQMGFSMIIATSASVEYAKKFLSLHTLTGYFDEIISSESFKKSKPVLYSCIKKRFPNYTVCAIEDSDNGLLAAFNAGVKTIFFNPLKRTSHSCFHNKFSDFVELPKIIKEIFDYGYFISCNIIKLHLKNHQLHFTEIEIKQIENIWNHRPKTVYNGRVVAIESYQYINGNLILNCFITEYKYIYALREKITPLAVSGICFDNDNNTIISVRNQVTDYSGEYELVPSGGIEENTIKENPFGYQHQLAKEFVEELGTTVSPQHIKDINNLGICYDAVSNTVDICMKINYDGAFRKDSIATNTEYKNNSILIDNIPSMKKLLQGKTVVYTTQEILKHIK